MLGVAQNLASRGIISAAAQRSGAPLSLPREAAEKRRRVGDTRRLSEISRDSGGCGRAAFRSGAFQFGLINRGIGGKSKGCGVPVSSVFGWSLFCRRDFGIALRGDEILEKVKRIWGLFYVENIFFGYLFGEVYLLTFCFLLRYFRIFFNVYFLLFEDFFG